MQEMKTCHDLCECCGRSDLELVDGFCPYCAKGYDDGGCPYCANGYDEEEEQEDDDYCTQCGRDDQYPIVAGICPDCWKEHDREEQEFDKAMAAALNSEKL